VLRRDATRVPTSAWALAALAWFAATFFLLGDRGWWNDDWFFTNRDMVTGGYGSLIKGQLQPFHPPEGWPLASRPLCFIVQPTLITLLWDHPWAMHLIGALTHAANCLLLYALARELGAGRRAAWLAGTLLAVDPVHFEAVFWASTYICPISFTLLLVCLVTYARWLRGRAGAGAMVFGTLCGCAVPYLYELGAPVLFLMPVLSYGLRHAVPARPRITRLVPFFVVAAACLFYAANLILNPSPHGGLGSAGGLVKPARAIGVFLKQAGIVFESYTQLRYLGLGAIRTGLATLAAHWPLTLALAAAASLALVGVSRWWGRQEPDVAPGGAFTPPPWILPVFGALAAFSTLGPGSLVGSGLRPRMLYGVGVMLSLVIAWGAGLLMRSRRARTPLAAAALVLGLVWTTAMVGAQRAYQARERCDRTLEAMLRERIPEPGADAVFVALGVGDWPLKTGTDDFDTFLVGHFFWDWSHPFWIRHVYKRHDVDAIPVAPGTPLPKPGILQADERGMIPATLVRWDLRIDTPEGRRPIRLGHEKATIAWERVIPIYTMPDDVLPVSKLTIERPGGEPLVVTFPRVLRSIEAGACDPFEQTIRLDR